MLDFKSVFYSSFVRQGTNFVFVLIVYSFGLKIDLINLVNIQSLGATLGSIVAFLLIRKKVKFSFVFDSAWMKRLLNYGVFTMGTNVSAILLKSVDQWIVAGKLESTAPVAVLNVCARIFNLFEVPVTTVATIVFPQSAKRVAEQGLSAAKDLYEKSVALMLAIVLPGAMIGAAVPGYILFLVAGEKYMENSIVLQFTMIQVLLLPLQRQFGTILDSIGKPKVNFVFTILTMILNLVLNFVFVSQWGFMGSVYATSISYLVSVIGMLICLKAIIGIELLNVFRFIPESYRKLLGVVMKK
jgi:O-antigen/teichoic acid export membrane protein